MYTIYRNTCFHSYFHISPPPPHLFTIMELSPVSCPHGLIRKTGWGMIETERWGGTLRLQLNDLESSIYTIYSFGIFNLNSPWRESRRKWSLGF